LKTRLHDTIKRDDCCKSCILCSQEKFLQIALQDSIINYST
jgi:hypothetical protein